MALLALSAPSGAQQCYELIGPDGQTLYKDPAPPFSLAWPPEPGGGQAESRRRGEHLIIHTTPCSVERHYRQPHRPMAFGLSPDTARPRATPEGAPRTVTTDADVTEDAGSLGVRHHHHLRHGHPRPTPPPPPPEPEATQSSKLQRIPSGPLEHPSEEETDKGQGAGLRKIPPKP